MSTVSPSSIELNIAGNPSASTITPTICSIVVMRKSQTSVSYADANQEKLVHAQVIANVANAKPTSAGRTWSSAR